MSKKTISPRRSIFCYEGFGKVTQHSDHLLVIQKNWSWKTLLSTVWKVLHFTTKQCILVVHLHLHLVHLLWVSLGWTTLVRSIWLVISLCLLHRRKLKPLQLSNLLALFLNFFYSFAGRSWYLSGPTKNNVLISMTTYKTLNQL